MSCRPGLLLCLATLTPLSFIGCDDELAPPSEPLLGGEAAGVAPAPRCGDATVDPGELCDDGNTLDGDGCSADCEIEPPPALCEAAPTDECDTCGCTACADEMEACNDVEGVAAEGPGAGIPKAELCQQVVQCAQRSDCLGSECYCGDLDLFVCLTFGPQGPCQREISAAAESNDPITVSARQATEGFAIAAASAVSVCSEAECSQACADRWSAAGSEAASDLELL